MSTAGPTDPQPHFTPPPSGLPAADAGAPPGMDPALVQQTKNEIRALVQEITQLAQADVAADEFYQQFLVRVVQALAATGGAVWTVDAHGGLALQYQTNLSNAVLGETADDQQRHRRLLQNVVASGQPTLVPPHSGSSSDGEAGNPTHYLLVLATLRVERETVGVVEVFQRAGGGPTTQRGYLRFLVQMSELASDFLKNRRLRHLGDRKALWENLERFLRQVHRRLEWQATAYTIVNEGRRLLGADRVSLALARGRQHKVVAVSGLDTIDRRAEEVRRLGELATAVAAGRRPLWYDGASDKLPPQIEEPLQAYLDQSHATMLAAVPLVREGDQDDAPPAAAGPALATLIVEQLGDHRVAAGLRDRVQIVAAHSTTALANALDHDNVFLMPLWRKLGQAKCVLAARNLPKTLLAAAALAALVLTLVLWPADFDLAARGKLQPAVRREIFSHLDGVIIDVPVRHEQIVPQGQLLARLKNNQLEADIANLIGRKRTTQERRRAVQRAQLDDRRLTIEEQNRLGGEMLELKQIEENIDRELALLREKEEQLMVRSPMAGQVVTWNVEDQLLRRPVRVGQALMTVVDPGGPWELELYVPERRMGHVARAAAAGDEPLQVSFVLASHPGLEFLGRVVEIHRTAEVYGDDGNAVVARVAIDKHQLPELRSETTVTAKIHCGRRSIGYVVFHELLETIQAKVLFWF